MRGRRWREKDIFFVLVRNRSFVFFVEVGSVTFSPTQVCFFFDAAARMSDAPAPAPGAPAAGTGSKTPADFLKSIKGRSVIVKLNSGSDYRGKNVSKADFNPPLRRRRLHLTSLSFSLSLLAHLSTTQEPWRASTAT